MFGKVKIHEADRLFSLFVRYRDNWTCQRCKRKFTQRDSRLQCSHYFGRTKKSVRWDLENCDALCFGCHRYWEKEDREGYRAFKIRQLGEKGYQALMIRANTPEKIDKQMIVLTYRQAFKDLGIKV